MEKSFLFFVFREVQKSLFADILLEVSDILIGTSDIDCVVFDIIPGTSEITANAGYILLIKKRIEYTHSILKQGYLLKLRQGN